ncbi:hypothetical protein K2173_011615 [Erythroxylum novogranatense]|uniref:Uncharacterized protein n=1 Tax=Erythroxylum novogranatense TaxID=1862640 RepID=A0AAV8U4Z5_9ROSI|nr:hypothetical protein K2173_011615 [Erythroxylum novogranatense]
MEEEVVREEGNVKDLGFDEDVVHDDEVNIHAIKEGSSNNENVGTCENGVKGDNEVEGEDDDEVEGVHNTFDVSIQDGQ